MRPLNPWTRLALIPAVIVAVTSHSSLVRADDEPTEIERLVHALSATDFVARRQAEQELVSRGAEAVDALATAAAEGPRERTLRCLDLLSRLMHGDDEAASEAAKKALEGLAESEDAALAQRARGLIEKPADPPQLLPNPAGIRLQIMQQQVANNRKISVTETNGERVVRVEEEGREIEIRSRDGKNIRMEVTEEVGGEKKTTEYEADDLDELKEDHPEAAKLYEEFNQQGGGVQVQAFFNVIGGAGGFRLPGRAVPVPVPQRNAAGGAGRSDAAPLLDDSIESLKKLREGLQENGNEQSVEELVRRLEEVEQQLRSAREKLE